MAVTLTIGTNSYISIVDANTYFNERLYSTSWNSASEDDKARALIMACKSIERQFFKGQKKENDQILAFPRCFIVDNKDYYYAIDPIKTKYNPLINSSMIWYCEEEISQNVKDAQCEEALSILDIGNSKRRKLQNQGVQSFSLEGVSETFRPGAGRGLMSQEAKELLRQYLAGAVNIC